MLYEKWRPTTLDDVVGQDKVVSRLKLLDSRGGLAGRAYWFAGQSGTGKTTIARVIARMIADEFCIEEIDSTGLSAARIQELERHLWHRGLGKGGRAVIINEAHGLTKGTIRQLLTTLESIPPFAMWCFTTTIDGQENLFDEQVDAHPLLSRCVELPLSRRGLTGTPARNGQPPKPGPFALLAHRIASAEGLNGQPIEAYITLLQRCKGNLRQALQLIESGEMLT